MTDSDHTTRVTEAPKKNEICEAFQKYLRDNPVTIEDIVRSAREYQK